MAGGFVTLLSAGILAQAIGIAALPVLGRLYDPVAFGQLAAVMAVVSLAAVAVHGRFHLAIPLAKDEADARGLLRLASLSSIVLALPVALAIFLLLGALPDGLSLASFVAIAITATAASALLDVFAYWRSRKARFKASARNQIVRVVVAVTVQIALSIWTDWGMLIGALAGITAALLLALLDALRHERNGRAEACTPLREVAGRYRAFPLYGMPQGWVAAFSWNAMPLLMLRFGDTALAGQYWLAYRLLVAPVALFGGSYRQAVLPALQQADADAAHAMARRHTLLIAAAAAIPAFLLWHYGEALFGLVIGAKWVEAGAMAGWLALAILADCFKIPAMCLMQRLERQARVLVWETGILVLRYGLALFFFLKGDPSAAIAAFALAGLGGWALFCLAEFAAFFPRIEENRGGAYGAKS